MLLRECHTIVYLNSEIVRVTRNPVDIVNYANGSAAFQCQASGIPAPTISWFRNTLILQSSVRVTIASSNTMSLNQRNTTSVLTITELQISDTADYHCVASNPGATGTGVTFTDTSTTASLLVHCKLLM